MRGKIQFNSFSVCDNIGKIEEYSIDDIQVWWDHLFTNVQERCLNELNDAGISLDSYPKCKEIFKAREEKWWMKDEDKKSN